MKQDDPEERFSYRTEDSMEELSDVELLQRYRRDRYDLLNFVLTSGFLEVIVPPGALSLEDIDLDQVDVEFVLECARNRRTLEVQEAIKTHYTKNCPLPKVNLGTRDAYFLVTDPEVSGSPPARSPPLSTENSNCPITLISECSCESSLLQSLSSTNMSEDIKHCIDLKQEIAEEVVIRRKDYSSSDLIPLFPPFNTGLSIDDLRETAYEVLLASVGGSVGLVSPTKEGRDEYRHLPRRLTYEQRDKSQCQSSKTPGLAGLLDTMRIQLEVSKSMDKRTREALSRAAYVKSGRRMDNFLIPLEFILVVSWPDFNDINLFKQWRKRQLNLLEEGLLHHPAVQLEDDVKVGAELQFLIKRVEEFQEATAPPEKYADILRALYTCASALAQRPREGDHKGEICHWADGYHLNVCIYEMLLSSIFDVINEGEILGEVEDILELLKSTWRMLGISPTVHDLCFTWVLFRQFTLTGEKKLLSHAAQQIKRITHNGQRSLQEQVYLQSLYSIVTNNGLSSRMTLVQSLFIPMKLWVDKKLEDYHMHFFKNLDLMDEHVTIAMIASNLLAEEAAQFLDGFKHLSLDGIASFRKQAKDYIISAIQLEYERILCVATSREETKVGHHLLLLTEDLKGLLEKEISLFSPILSHWNDQSLAISLSLIHNLYYKQLKPFVENITYLTDDLKPVIQEASKLEQSVRSFIIRTFGNTNIYLRKMETYQLEAVTSKFISRWTDFHLKKVVSFVQHSILEEDWTPFSLNQCQSKSIIQIIVLLQETLHQFFGLCLPMSVNELLNIVAGLDKALKLYCNCILSQIGTVEDLMPPVPNLTRHGKDTLISFSKKKITEEKALDDEQRVDTTLLSTMKLCIRLNSLHYILCQVDAVETSILEQWAKRWPNEDLYFPTKISSDSERKGNKEDLKGTTAVQMDGELSGLFLESRKVAGVTLDKVCEFTGTKIIFFDMRDAFINGLYKGTVSSSRIHDVLDGLDLVIGELLESIVEPLREHIVMGLLRATLNGLLRVLLDGGPSRAFSQSDSDLLFEDLQILKEFFIADGDGLPPPLVDAAAEIVKDVLELYRSETTVVIQNFKNASENQPARITRRASRDVNILLRVLCHRTDSEASKFLKKHNKLLKASN